MTRAVFSTAVTLDGYLADEHDSLEWTPARVSCARPRAGWCCPECGACIDAPTRGRVRSARRT